MSNAAILKHFPGASNAGLRARIREALHRAPTVADAMNGIRYTVALSPSGAAKLSALESELRHDRAGGKRTAKRSSNRAGSGSVTTKKLRDMGYTCQLETVKGQGYFGGDGVQAYRVRDPQGKLVNYPISTHKTARAAWEEAADRVQSGR